MKIKRAFASGVIVPGGGSSALGMTAGAQTTIRRVIVLRTMYGNTEQKLVKLPITVMELHIHKVGLAIISVLVLLIWVHTLVNIRIKSTMI